MADSLDDLKHKAILSHRILTMTGSMSDTTGHVMVRVPGSDEMLVRCRGPRDWSPRYVEEAAMHRLDFDGEPTEELGDWVIPPERFIGATVFRMRPEVNCAIHAHPPAQVLCSNTNVGLRPIVGSQNWGGSLLAMKRIPVYPRSLLIHSPEIGRSMMSVMGSKDVVLLKGHGNVVVGRSIEEATVRAIQIENLARLCWQIALSGLEGPDIPWEDVEDNAEMAVSEAARRGDSGSNPFWTYYVQLLERGWRIEAKVNTV